MAADDLIAMDACSAVDRLRAGELSPHDLLDALERRIAMVDPAVNALPTLCFDRARAAADELLRRPPAERGPLYGLPVPIKDLMDVAGVRTTYGSLIYADNLPAKSNILVERLEAGGGIVYAKSNTPEFGDGGNTFNDVFGATLNPWNTARSAAGSSGGAAVALATGMAWAAHGSDMGGSLRSPASFCGVLGLRPSIGRVARTPGALLDGTLSVEGPMARNVDDLALILDAMSGHHPLDPLSLPTADHSFRLAAASGWRPRRVAYSPNLGITPVDPEVASLTRSAAEKLAGLGIAVEEAQPDLSEAHECFRVLRALNFAVARGHTVGQHRERMKPELVGNIEEGLALSVAQIARAEAQRVVLARRMLAFFDQYDLLLCPATIVAPYPVAQRYVAECAGQRFETHFEWLAIAYAVTLACCPALSLPCGFTREQLPVGLQIVGPPRSEGRLLAGARLLEELLGLRDITPILPRGAKA